MKEMRGRISKIVLPNNIVRETKQYMATQNKITVMDEMVTASCASKWKNSVEETRTKSRNSIRRCKKEWIILLNAMFLLQNQIHILSNWKWSTLQIVELFSWKHHQHIICFGAYCFIQTTSRIQKGVINFDECHNILIHNLRDQLTFTSSYKDRGYSTAMTKVMTKKGSIDLHDVQNYIDLKKPQC